MRHFGVAHRLGEFAAHELLLGAGEPRARMIAVGFVNHAQFIPRERVFAILGHRRLEHALRFDEVGAVLARDQRVAEGGGDQRGVGGERGRTAQWFDRLQRFARFEQDLTLEFKEIGIVGRGSEQRVGFDLRLVHQRFLVERVSAGIAGGNGGFVFGKVSQRCRGLGEIAVELGLYPLKPRLQLGIGLRVPGRIVLVSILQRCQAIVGQGVRAVEFGLCIARIAVAILLVLQLLEEIDAALARQPRFRQELRTGRVGRGFLRAAE